MTAYHLTNLQSDIVGILDSSGTSVATYTYNAWGKLLASSGDLASINPLRYRGYYYDAELEMYYLKSRYYDPEICRFINADDSSQLGANSDFASFNLFAYCGNNPNIRSDAEGTDWKTAFAVGITVAVVGLAVLATLPFCGPLLAGAGVAATAVATAANATVAAGLTIAGSSILVAAASTGGRRPTELGKEGEKQAGIDPSKKETIEINGRKRIPDEMKNEILKEVKM